MPLSLSIPENRPPATTGGCSGWKTRHITQLCSEREVEEGGILLVMPTEVTPTHWYINDDVCPGTINGPPVQVPRTQHGLWPGRVS